MARKRAPIKNVMSIQRLNDGFVIQSKIGGASLFSKIGRLEFHDMLDMILEDGNVSQLHLEKMAAICRMQFRKGNVARRLRPETIEQFKTGYANFYSMSWESITTFNRKRAFIEIRMNICGHLDSLGYTFAEIATHFIPRDRTTIMSAVQRFKDLCETDKTMVFNAKLLSDHMDNWMLGGLKKTFDPVPQQPSIPLDQSMQQNEPRSESIHTTRDMERIDRESTMAANSIGEALQEIWAMDGG